MFNSKDQRITFKKKNNVLFFLFLKIFKEIVPKLSGANNEQNFMW